MQDKRRVLRFAPSAAVLGLILLSLPATSLRAESVTARMNVSVTVLARTILTVDATPAEVEVTAADIARGYVELPGALAFRVRSNSPAGYALDFQAVSGPFASASVRWGSTEVMVGSGEAMMAQPYQRAAQAVVATVRLALSKDAQPGVYGWPLQLSARSL